MINRVVLVGRLTKDPTLKYTQSGIAVTRFTLAVNRTFTNQQGEREADFINCITWRRQAENTANYLRKGSLAGIEGRIQTSNFQGKDGNRVFMTDVVVDSVQFLESRNASAGRDESQQGTPSQNNYQHQPSYQSNQQPGQPTNSYKDDPFTGGSPVDISDDDLPF